MLGKHYRPLDLSSQMHNHSYLADKSHLSALKMRCKDITRNRDLRKRIFGEHYNYSFVSLNKQNKFLKEEERNTEIERSNRILLEKIQRICKRSIPKKRNLTQETEATEREDLLKAINRKQSVRGNYQKSMRGLQSISKLQFNESRATAFLGNKITIYKGKKSIDGVTFHISIFIEGNKYLIVTERGRTQQRIQMLVDDYNVLLRDYLQGIHTGIFDLLQVNQRGILEFIGVKKNIIDVITQQQLLLPNPEENDVVYIN